MSSAKSRSFKARERFLLITLVTIISTGAILLVGLFFLSVPLSGVHHDDCSAFNCRVATVSSNLYLEYDLITSRNLTKTIKVIFDDSLLSDSSLPCIINPLSSNHTTNITTSNSSTTTLLSNNHLTKSSSDHLQNSFSSLPSIPPNSHSQNIIIITFHSTNYSITTNTSSSASSNLPCYYNDANSFFFDMTFSLPKAHAQLELILGGVMIPFIIVVVGCLCCLPLFTAWICMKEEILERKQKVDFHKLDSTWDE